MFAKDIMWLEEKINRWHYTLATGLDMQLVIKMCSLHI